MEPGDSFWVDRDFESVRFAIRLGDAGLQFYALEGDLITQWFDQTLTDRQISEYWNLIDQAKLETLDPLYREPEPSPGDPPIIREVDDLVVRMRRHGEERFIRVMYRPAGPEVLAQLAEELEGRAVRQGNAPRNVRQAFLSEDLDVRNFPANVTIAEAMENGGIHFRPLTPAWLDAHPKIHDSVRRAGWLIPIAAEDIPNDFALPALVEVADNHVRLRQLNVRLVIHNMEEKKENTP